MSIIQNPEQHWEKAAQDLLVGRTIVAARYLDKKEATRLGWHTRSVIFELDDGTLLWPSMDDEGNGAGAMFTTDRNQPTLPVLSIRYQSSKE
jgi:hypothetical protein